MPNNQPQMMDADAAYALVHQNVYAPVFFTKLANDYGIRPESAEAAQKMLTMAAQLREGHEQQQIKQASQGGSLLDAAQQHLNAAMAQEGFNVYDGNDQLIEKAAHELAFDPEIAAAVLSLQANAAAAMANN